MNWKTGSYQNDGQTVWVNPNGNPKDNSGYYTQSRKFYNEWKDFYNEAWASYYAKDPIARDADKYNQWEEMHDGVQWFDTAACWKGSFIGNANSVTIAPDNTNNIQYNRDFTKTYSTPTATSDATSTLNGKDESGAAFGDFWGGWYIGASYEDKVSPKKDYDDQPAYNPLGDQIDANGPFMRNWQLQTVQTSTGPRSAYQQVNTFRSNAWDVELSVSGSNNWNQKDLTTDLMKAVRDLEEDCDMDCQKFGSGLSVIAQLMGGAYGIIGLNALFMFIGAWRYRWRVCSVYCTLVACLCQLILSIVSATMLFTKYNNVCGRSLTNTFEGFRWTMNDDIMMTFNLWVASLILMLPFVCCGMCSAYVSIS